MKLEYWKMLTKKEHDAVCAKSARIRWGFTPKSIRAEFRRYMKGNDKTKAKVCCLLEDCNYHTLCGYLANGDVSAAVEWMDKEMPLPAPVSQKTVTAYIMEGSKGEYLHMNSTEDGDGTWWDWSKNMFEAYWNKDLEGLQEIASTEFSDFKEGYPKFHKVKFSAKILETIQE